MKHYIDEQPALLANRKAVIITLRLIVFACLYLIIFQERGLSGHNFLFWLVSGIFLASQAVYLFEHQAHFLVQRILGWVFIFDAALISLLIYLLGIRSDQLFITYFAVIAIAAIAKNVKASVVITLLVSAFYIFVSLNEGGLTMAELATRPLFFFGASISVGYLTEEISLQHQGRMNITRHFRSLIDNTPDFVTVLDREGKILFINRAQPGIDKDKAIGASIYDYLSPEYYAVVRNAVEQVFQTGQPAYYEASGKGSDSSLAPLEASDNEKSDLIKASSSRSCSPLTGLAWYESRISPILEGDLIIAATVISTDITGRKKAEAELQKTREQLFQIQKMDAIGRLVGGIAHDFNNIIHLILGYSDLLLTDMTPDSPNYSELSEISKAGYRAADLTAQLLAFSRQKTPEPKPLNLNDAISNMQKMLRRIIGEDVKLELDLDPDILPVRADSGQFGQVIMNLAINARDAMPKGGRLTVKTHRVSISPDYIKYNPEANPGDFICVSVNDTGVGITKEVMAHIFEPFFTTKKEGKGTGLGLSTVYGIVKQHQGWIHIYSEIGGGANVNVYLPVNTDVAVKPDTRTIALPATAADSTAGKTVLVVEDEKALSSFISQGLRRCGFTVSEAATAREALDLFRKDPGAFHLALIDIGLPDKNGIQLAEELFTHRPGFKVLFSSGYVDDKSRWQIIAQKGYKLLHKPFGIDTLVKTINELSEACPVRSTGR